MKYLLLLLPLTAWAGEVTFKITPPTQCSVPGGRPISECPITGFSIESSKQDLIEYTEVLRLTPDQTIYVWKEAPVGKYLFRARALSGTSKGDPSKVLPYEVKDTPVPGPPLDFSVTGDLTAFQLNGGTNNKIYFTAVGTVPPDTKCNAAFKVMDKYMITDRNQLILKPGQKERPRQVYAWCS